MKPKSIHPLSAILALALFALALPAFAGLQTQVSTNSLLVSTTNTFALSGDVSGVFTNGEVLSAALLDGSKTTMLIGSVGGFFTNTTAQASNIVFHIASTVDGSNWTNKSQQVTVSVAASSTNWAVANFAIATPFPLYSLRSVENTNVAAVSGKASTLFFKVYTKTGL